MPDNTEIKIAINSLNLEYKIDEHDSSRKSFSRIWAEVTFQPSPKLNVGRAVAAAVRLQQKCIRHSADCSGDCREMHIRVGAECRYTNWVTKLGQDHRGELGQVTPTGPLIGQPLSYWSPIGQYIACDNTFGIRSRSRFMGATLIHYKDLIPS